MGLQFGTHHRHGQRERCAFDCPVHAQWVLSGSVAAGVVVICQGTRMPKMGTPLTAAQMDTIRAWIGAGALNN
jgi:hypothetical protein